jgi:VacB/RNase II family 3'-5' exoribonuclease
MNTFQANDNHHRTILQNIAHRVMLERGLLPDFSVQALTELNKIQTPSVAPNDNSVHDMRFLLWASIDNDDSLDLDQLTVAEQLPAGKVKVYVAVADVDSLVKAGSALDEHANQNTSSVYTAAEIFPMLPEKLSTDLTSLNANVDRMSIVVEFVVNADGTLQDSNIYQALVRNHAKLAYNSVAAWLEGNGGIPEPITAVDGLEENLRMQDRAAQSLKNFRHIHGALSLETIEAKPVFDGDQIRGLEVEEKNRAKEIIEDFMIAANGVSARYLASKNFPSIRRVVRVPKRWDRIVDIAREKGFSLPVEPDSKVLEEFLIKAKSADPLRFPDLSLAVIKLLGSGEYIAEQPGGIAPGHFGLAVRDYSHSTAPNRRYTDLITQRLLKAAIEGKPAPYTFDELSAMAKHFTEQEDAVNKVERQVGKSAAALLLESKIGQQFDAIVTGAADKGTWARLLDIPVEGRIEQGFEGLDVGDRVRVQLISTNVDRGFIDFKKVGSTRR